MFLSFIISWFGTGLISTILSILYDLRGSEFNEKYMREEWDLKYFMFGIFLGWFMPILLFYYIYEDMDIGTDISKKVYAVLYKITNIGKDSNE